jgi:hypothetical protein
MQPDEKVESALAALANLSRERLAARWERAYGHPPPKGVGRRLLELSAAWPLQRKVYRGLSPEAQRILNRAIADFEGELEKRRERREERFHQAYPATLPASLKPLSESDGCQRSYDDFLAEDTIEQKAKHSASLSPGSRLVREWRGRLNFVDVVEKGYVFEGTTYRSLSAIAKEITGTHWSGPRFFGL